MAMMNFLSKPAAPSSAFEPSEIINARVPAGTGKRMDSVLKGGELRSAFIRAAIDAELKRREKKLRQKG